MFRASEVRGCKAFALFWFLGFVVSFTACVMTYAHCLQ